ncbi:Bardet-Biedl syndrome 10 protein homolog isoform X2 [Eriocheir sinensis]|nr:Bardet-Biedl syndrome 10 protein homolog isoform X2 [Eriocheir sinensis]XP_050689132.1 Bardet-Biedl syndrome 10 protein homolog isoform X2 [Eriocheir sinensis]XP_050689133.1 Bardet-Biedl syndrome 10 protein homolog isoform X2 [Eriocheir sinensis]
MECWRKDIDLTGLVVQCSSLVSVLEGSLGPNGKAVLMENAGCVVITKDGPQLLSRLELCDPLLSVVVRGVLDHTQVLGDGCKVTLFLLHRLLSSLDTHVPHSASRTQGIRRQRLIQIVQQIRNQVLGVVQRDVIKYGAQVYPLNSFEVFSHVLHTAAEDFFITKFSKLIAKNLAKLFSTYVSCVCSSSRELVKLMKGLAIKTHTAVVEVYHMPLMMSYVLNGFVVSRDFRHLHRGMKLDNVTFAWWSMSMEEEHEEGAPRPILQTCLQEVLVGGILMKRNAVEQTLASLSSLGTKLIFSSLYFPDWAVSLCTKYGLSLVDSVDGEERDFILGSLGVCPIMEESDVCPNSLSTLERIEPLQQGTCRFIQLSGLGVHQILLCGPTPGQCRQFSASFLQLFKYLSSWVADCMDFSQSTDIEECDAAAGFRDCFSPPYSPEELPHCELSPVLSEAYSSGPSSPTSPAVFFTVPHGGYEELLAKYLILENISVEIKNSVTKSVVLDVFNEVPFLLYRKFRFSRKSYVEFQTKLFTCFTETRKSNQKIVLPHTIKNDMFKGYQNPFLVFKHLHCALYFAEYLLRIECIVPAKQRISQLTSNNNCDSDSD